MKRNKRMLTCVIALAAALCLLLGASPLCLAAQEEQTDIAGQFTDEILRRIVYDAIGKEPGAAIYAEDAAGIEELEIAYPGPFPGNDMFQASFPVIKRLVIQTTGDTGKLTGGNGMFTDKLIDACLEERANAAIEAEDRVFADDFRICDENHFMKVFGK